MHQHNYDYVSHERENIKSFDRSFLFSFIKFSKFEFRIGQNQQKLRYNIFFLKEMFHFIENFKPIKNCEYKAVQ